MSIFHEVPEDEEFARIFSLPVRPIPDPKSPEVLALAREVTLALRKVDVPWPLTKESDSIYGHQALALKEAWENGGLLGLFPVGSGKTLISALLMTVLKPERPCLIIPSSMATDTKKTWAKLEQGWRIPPLSAVTVITYEKLSAPAAGARTLPNGATVYPDLITRHSPDLIVGDEVQRFGNVSAAGTRRIGRYLAEHPEVKFVGLTGTLIRTSLKQGAHIAGWALHERAPLPQTFEALEPWADCTDSRMSSGARTSPGPLLDQLSPNERRAYDLADSAEDARGVLCQMIGRRMLQTAGVLASGGGPLAIPARIDPVFPSHEDPAIEAEMTLLVKGGDGREAGSLPDGTILPDAAALARPLATMPLGFWYKQEPAAPQVYRDAASAWAKAVRDVIKYRSHLSLDSEFLVRDAVHRGVLPDLVELLQAWEAARAEYRAATGLPEPPSVPQWFSDEAIREVEAWLKDGPGLVWVGFVALGERLSKDLGLPYFSSGKRDAKKRHVTDLKKGESAILSHASVGVGTDTLQFKHHRQLWMTAPHEQSLGRVHRFGQEAEFVLNDLYLPGAQAHRRFWRSVQTSTNFAGKLAMRLEKLAYFENAVPKELERTGYRWSKSASADSGEDA